MAADEVVMGAGSMLMIHRASTFAFGDIDDLQRQIDLLKIVDESMVETFSARSKKPKSQVRAWMEAETWFTADQAVDNGFAERIAGFPPVSAKVNSAAAPFWRTPSGLRA